MKKIVLTTILFVFLNSVIAAKTTDLDIKAKRIASKTKNLNPSVVKLAMKASNNAREIGIKTSKPIMTIIDYSLPSSKKRLWVIDTRKENVLFHSLVAHGMNSGKKYSTHFSNTHQSHQTSLGLFLTKNVYYGKHGYSLRMKGLEKGFNDRAEHRGIVIHKGNYVSNEFVRRAGRIGRSWGCPAVETHLTKPIIDTVKNGTLVFSYYPDKIWLKSSKFINMPIRQIENHEKTSPGPKSILSQAFYKIFNIKKS